MNAQVSARVNSARYPSLNGKHVVITGGGSGIGASIVEAFAVQGAQVSFLDIAVNDAKQLERTLANGDHPAPKFYQCDLKDLDAVKSVLARVAQEHGPVQVLVNNAANDDRHEIQDVTPQYWDDRIAVNLRHLFFCTQAVVPAMRQAKKGVIINLGSISWHLGLPSITLYQTAKAGIEGMTRALARDLGEDNIRVTCVVPGGVRTPRQIALWHTPDEEQRILSQQCLKARVEPHDVAALTLFLASDDARMCTAHEYFVDAGWR